MGTSTCTIFPADADESDNVLINLRHSRVKSSSAVLEDTLHIIGGKSTADNFYSSRTTESITTAIRDECKKDTKADGCVTDIGVADPPVPIFAHCAVNFDETIWIIGGMVGEIGEEIASSSVYKLEDGEWTGQEPLNEARQNHACEVLTINGTEVLIVVGGFGAADETGKTFILDTVEIYNSTSGGFDTSLQPFPHPAGAYGIAYNSLVATSEGKLWSLGGTYDNSRDMTQIYELDCSADVANCGNTTWTEKSIKLAPARRGKVAMLLPADYLCCEGDASCNDKI